MRGQGVVEFDLGGGFGEGAIPAIRRDDGDVVIVVVCERSREDLPIGESDFGGDGLGGGGMEELEFELERLIFRGDAFEVARGGVAGSARGSEVGFARGGIAGVEFGERVVLRDGVRVQRDIGLVVEECGDIGDLGIGERWESRHAFIGAAVADDGADRVAVRVVTEGDGADQVRGAAAGGVLAVAEAAARLKGGLAASDGGGVGTGRLLGGREG